MPELPEEREESMRNPHRLHKVQNFQVLRQELTELRPRHRCSDLLTS
jgi:hypothetical protein